MPGRIRRADVLGGKTLDRPEAPAVGRTACHCPTPLPLPQAHEDSEKLREIVLPMEQEIEELKAKLLRAEELIQEIQVRGWPGGAEGGRGAAGPQPLSLFPAPSP